MALFYLYEYFNDAADRYIVKEVGVLDIPAIEAAEINRRLLLTPCRILPLTKQEIKDHMESCLLMS